MPLPTSDFHKPVCLEMRTLKSTHQHNMIGYAIPPPPPPSSNLSFSYGPNSTITLPLETPLRYSTTYNNNSNNVNNNFNENNCTGLTDIDGGVVAVTSDIGNGNSNNKNGDLASVDSSDTYASCQTHPFLSQGDLTSDLIDEACTLNIDMNNLYINPMEKEKSSSSAAGSTATPQSFGTPLSLSTSSTPMIRSQVKKSASGDTALRSLGTSPIDEGGFTNFDIPERGSRVSLNETPVPKHRKTRFQQSGKLRTRFEDYSKKISQESLGENKKRKSSFIPAKSLASATKLINQHLFGIQNIGSRGKKLV